MKKNQYKTSFLITTAHTKNKEYMANHFSDTAIASDSMNKQVHTQALTVMDKKGRIMQQGIQEKIN